MKDNLPVGKREVSFVVTEKGKKVWDLIPDMYQKN